MKRNAVVFLFFFFFLVVIFFGVFFGLVWGNLAKILSTPKNLPAATLMPAAICLMK